MKFPILLKKIRNSIRHFETKFKNNIKFLFHFGAPRYASLITNKFYFIKKAFKAKSNCSESKNVEIHMLLNKKRIYEGTWALSSLLLHCGPKSKIFIHNDGTISENDKKIIIDRIGFFKYEFIDKDFSDKFVTNILLKNNLLKTKKLRDDLIFSLKLIDPLVFSEEDDLIIMDSDVIFYQKPTKLLSSKEKFLYSPDNNDQCYCINIGEFHEKYGSKMISRFNPGVFKLNKKNINLNQIEELLEMDGFYKNGKPSYFAELTIWACIMSLNNAKSLGSLYQICPPNPDEEGIIFGHYCGGQFWAENFYAKGINLTRKKITQNPA